MTATQRSITFPASDGTRLAGTMTVPGPGSWPATLIINGSGPLDRDSAIPGQALGFACPLASQLAASGVASLRFDKRGVGESGGDFLSTGLDQEAADAASALAWLKDAPEVAAAVVALIGHSVGALISIRLAAADSTVRAIALLAGPAQDGRAVLAWQSARIAASLPGPSWFLPKVILATQRYALGKLENSTADTIRLPFKRQPALWMREFMAYHPAEDLGNVTCPVLAITGRKDLQVDPDDVARIGALVQGPFTGETPANLTHLLRMEEGLGGITSYRSQLKRPVDPDLIRRVSGWIADELGAQPPPR